MSIISDVSHNFTGFFPVSDGANARNTVKQMARQITSRRVWLEELGFIYGDVRRATSSSTHKMISNYVVSM